MRNLARNLDDPRLERLPPTHATASEIKITTRSLRQLLFLFSQGVDVPLCHLQQGIVVTTLNPDSSAFDWQQVLRGLFHTSVSESKPKYAAVAVPYRGYWFFIDERDHGTKNSLLLLDELGTIQIEAGGEENLPVLTLM